MSVEDWDALPENEFLKTAELVEGVLELAPTPSVDHQLAVCGLAQQLNAGGLRLQLAPLAERPRQPRSPFVVSPRILRARAGTQGLR
jgi:hypothetical protein